MSQKRISNRRHFLGAASLLLAATPLGIARSVWQSEPHADTLPLQTELSSLDNTSEWLNSSPLKAADLQGKVVLIDFWTYTCINWIRTVPYVRAWAKQYQEDGLVVIGVHTPEFSFEHDLDNVRRAVKKFGVDYPVVIDNNYSIWQAFHNNYWPALYLVDPQGRIRHRQFGEGEYELSERMIQKLLTKAGSRGIDQKGYSLDALGVEAAADWNNLRSPENYVGYTRTEHFSSPGGIRSDIRHTYKTPKRLALNQWALSGDWTIKSQAIALSMANGIIVYRFQARDLHLVMGPAKPGISIRFRVRIDGVTPGKAHGVDVDEQGNGTVTESRLYQLIRQPNPIRERQFEIEFLDADLEAFAFTFG